MIDGIPNDLLADWKGYEISQRVIRAMQDEKDNLTKLITSGFFVDRTHMSKTFGGSVYATAKMEGLDEFFNLISGGESDED